MVQEIRQVQNLALSSRVSSECGGKVVPYGINLNTAALGQYVIAADCSDPLNYSYNNGGSELVNTVFLDEVIINTLNPQVSGKLDIFFNPPIPDVYVNGSNSNPAVAATMRLCHAKVTPLLCKDIDISSKGAVSTRTQ